jgi:uncharacterized protein YnzC (UPF0291/DUF896 family)
VQRGKYGEKPCENPQCSECPKPRPLTVGYSSSSQKATVQRASPTDRPTKRQLPNASGSPTDRPTNSSPQRQITSATPSPPKIVTAPSDLFNNNKPGNSIFISPPVAIAKWDPIKNSTIPTVKQPGWYIDCNDMIPGGLTNLLARQKKQNNRAMEKIKPQRKLRRPYIAVPMGLPSTSADWNKKENEDWCRKHISNWCKGIQIIDTKGHIIKNANNNVDDNMIPYINKDDGKQLYKVPQRRMKSDETYAREDLDLDRSLCRNAAAAAAAAASADASIMD